MSKAKIVALYERLSRDDQNLGGELQYHQSEDTFGRICKGAWLITYQALCG